MSDQNTVKRYDLELIRGHGHTEANEMVEYPTGEWVRYDDVKHLLEPSHVDESVAQFKNFHRLLCERFEYHHDDIDWKRDQLSLIEHIAKLQTAKDRKA